MRSIILCTALLFVSHGMSGVALADKHDGPGHEVVALDKLLDAVSKDSGKEFLIEVRVPTEVVTGTLDIREIDYAILLSILRNNGLAAVGAQSVTKIVPVNTVRQHALPIVREADPSIPDDEWVTRTLVLEKVNASGLVPILRPMIQQAGHLAAVAGSNMLVIVAPYGVTERLVDIAMEADRNVPDTRPDS